MSFFKLIDAFFGSLLPATLEQNLGMIKSKIGFAHFKFVRQLLQPFEQYHLITATPLGCSVCLDQVCGAFEFLGGQGMLDGFLIEPIGFEPFTCLNMQSAYLKRGKGRLGSTRVAITRCICGGIRSIKNSTNWCIFALSME